MWAGEVVAYGVFSAVFAEVVESLCDPFAADDFADEYGSSWCGDGVLQCWENVFEELGLVLHGVSYHAGNTLAYASMRSRWRCSSRSMNSVMVVGSGVLVKVDKGVSLPCDDSVIDYPLCGGGGGVLTGDATLD